MNVPDRWLEYSRLKKPIQDTRIIVIKTPLKESFNNGLFRAEARRRHGNNGVPKEDEFTPSQLIDILHSQGLKLGLVIDLTNTHRYYNRKSFEDVGILYYKIQCYGQEIPSDEVYKL